MEKHVTKTRDTNSTECMQYKTPAAAIITYVTNQATATITYAIH